jgi:ketosteroid isomerase-like protein
MADEDVALVSEALSHWARTGEANWDVVSEQVEIRDHDLLDASEYRGRGGFDRWMADWGEAWSSFGLELQELLDAGDHVVVAFVRITATGKGSTVSVERDDAIVYRVRDGSIATVDYYNNRPQALEAAGLGG